MAAQIVTWVCGLITFILIPRFLGSAAYGRVYLALSIQMILSSLIDYGASFLITKEISRDRSNASGTMSHAVVLRTFLWVLSVFLAYLICVVAHYPPSVTVLVMILAVANAWVNMTKLLRYCYLGFEEIKYPSVGAVVERGFMMVSVTVALLLGAKEEVVVILIAISTLMSFAISVKYSRSMFKLNLSVHLETFRRMIRSGVPYFLWAIFGIIYFRIDAVLLSLFAPDSVVGWYGAAYRFFDVLMFLPSIFTQALYPIVTRLSKDEPESMVTTTRRSIELLFLTSLPIAIGMILFARPIVQLLLGLPAFEPSISVLQLLSFGTVLVYVDFVLGNSVMALDKQKTWALVGFAAMILNVGLNLILIKHFQSLIGNGGVGSAIATDLTELFVMLSAAALMPRKLFNASLWKVVAKGVLSGSVMVLLIFGGMEIGIPWALLAVFSIIVYGGILVVIGAVDQRVLEFLTNTISARGIRRFLAERRGANA